MNRKKIILMVCAVLVLAAAAALLLWPEGDGTDTAYADFSAALDAGTVETAAIEPDCVIFTLVGDDTEYTTDNPDTDDFKERLLLAGVAVSDKTDGGDTLTAVFDILLDVVIAAVVIFAVYSVFGKYRKNFRLVRHTGVHFADIAGMENVKRNMMQITALLKDPNAARQRGLRPIKGIILEGPPGNGKTLFARALAEEAGMNFIASKGADFQSALMSMGAANIKLLFKKAARHKPCIIFIDEFDGIGERRNYAGTGVDKENNRIITAMLNEMDGFQPLSGVLVIAATNSYESLDTALIRPGRFDLKFTVPNPDEATRRQLIDIYTRNRTLDPGVDPAALAHSLQGLSCAAVETVLNEAARITDAAGRTAITGRDIGEALKNLGGHTQSR